MVVRKDGFRFSLACKTKTVRKIPGSFPQAPVTLLSLERTTGKRENSPTESRPYVDSIKWAQRGIYSVGSRKSPDVALLNNCDFLRMFARVRKKQDGEGRTDCMQLESLRAVVSQAHT